MSKLVMVRSAKAMLRHYEGVLKRSIVNGDLELEAYARENVEYYKRKIKRLSVL